MRYNGTATVWHKTNEGYIPSHYPCWRQDTEAENINKTGLTNADTALVYLPVTAVVVKNDYIKFGEYDDNYVNSSDLLKAHKPLKVSTASQKPYGSPHMQHTEVTAK